LKGWGLGKGKKLLRPGGANLVLVPSKAEGSSKPRRIFKKGRNPLGGKRGLLGHGRQELKKEPAFVRKHRGVQGKK